MAQMVVKDYYGAPQTVCKLADTGPLAGAESMSTAGAARERLCPCGVALRACQCPLRQAKRAAPGIS